MAKDRPRASAYLDLYLSQSACEFESVVVHHEPHDPNERGGHESSAGQTVEHDDGTTPAYGRVEADAGQVGETDEQSRASVGAVRGGPLMASNSLGFRL